MIVRKKIFVTGAAGNQGGAVVRNLLSKGFNVKALVRKPAAAKLSPQDSLEIIKGDLNDPASYRSHLKNVDDACFVKDMQALQNEFPGMLSLEEWIRMNFK